jgi:hypothetical protein
MQSDQQPASHLFNAALLKILQRTETLLQRRSGGQDLPKEALDEWPDTLASVEVHDSDWESWVQAGGDLLTGNGAKSPASEAPS